MDWRTVFQDFENLDYEQKLELFRAIRNALFPDTPKPLAALVAELREARFADAVMCPHCQSQSVKRNGKYRSRQRYLCRGCGRSFNDLTASPIAGTHYPELWQRYFECMVEGLSLPKIAKKLGIHVSTAFYWRHKILNAIRSLGADTLSGIAECDETFFLESMKGKKRIPHREARQRGGKSQYKGISHEQVCVVVAVDRNGGIVSQVAGIGRPTAYDINSVLGQYISPTVTLCTDLATSYKRFAQMKGLVRYRLNANKGIRMKKSIYQIQHVNAYYIYYGRVNSWMERFNDASRSFDPCTDQGSVRISAGYRPGLA
ncbi:MAG: IS1595 family transposase, partial [Thermoflavifilum sp.]|nr:IS1595 family transposase [Thermoflavifilum sp.]